MSRLTSGNSAVCDVMSCEWASFTVSSSQIKTLTCSFSCVSSSNSFSASASEWSLSRRSGAASSQGSGRSNPLQAPCSSQPSWEFPSGGFTLPEDSGCWRSEGEKADIYITKFFSCLSLLSRGIFTKLFTIHLIIYCCSAFIVRIIKT